jgi:hypothetical protein
MNLVGEPADAHVGALGLGVTHHVAERLAYDLVRLGAQAVADGVVDVAANLHLNAEIGLVVLRLLGDRGEQQVGAFLGGAEL